MFRNFCFFVFISNSIESDGALSYTVLKLKVIHKATPPSRCRSYAMEVFTSQKKWKPGKLENKGRSTSDRQSKDMSQILNEELREESLLENINTHTQIAAVVAD